MALLASGLVVKKKRVRKSKKTKTVLFQEEFVTKNAAQKILKQKKGKLSSNDEKSKNSPIPPRKKQTVNKLNSNKINENNHETPEIEEIKEKSEINCEENIKKNKKRKIKQKINASEGNDNKQMNNGDSIRQHKRKKYMELLKQNKLNADMAVKERGLNYLSQWKHSRTEWKFQKKRQIWLKDSMFDSNKIPDESWDIFVEYFSNSKGHIREEIMKSALEVIEKQAEIDEVIENTTKIKRAKNIIQHLQE